MFTYSAIGGYVLERALYLKIGNWGGSWPCHLLASHLEGRGHSVSLFVKWGPAGLMCCPARGLHLNVPCELQSRGLRQHYECCFLTSLSLRCSLSSFRFDSKHMRGLQGAGFNNHLIFCQARELLHHFCYIQTRKTNTQIFAHWKNIKMFEGFLKLGFTWYWNSVFIDLPMLKSSLWQEPHLPLYQAPGTGRPGCLERAFEGLGSLEGMGSCFVFFARLLSSLISRGST